MTKYLLSVVCHLLSVVCRLSKIHGRGVVIAVPLRRVGVARVGLLTGASVPVMGNVSDTSGVGVGEGSSRVGMGAWVGVGSKVPAGGLMNVGGGCVGVRSPVVRVMTVGVGGRGIKLGRIKRLNVPMQYITNEPITAIARQP